MPSEWPDPQYDEKTQSLLVTFPNGRSYVYEGVPPDIAKKYAESDDRGVFFNVFIRGQY